MRQQWLNRFKYTALISLTTLLVSVGGVKAQRDAEEVVITDSSGKEVILYEQSHALVIWAGNYQQHWSKLNNVENEAKQVIAALERRGFKVTPVGNPNGEKLTRAIKTFIDNYGYQPDNRLVIFFAGHGHTRQRTKGYLVPVDAPDPRTSRANEQKFLSLALPMQQIITWARLMEAKHVLFVFDSCFSGTVFKQRSSTTPTRYILDVMAKPVRQFLTAGDADEKVPAKSVFTPLFIRALDGEADTISKDGYVTGVELGNYLRQNLKEYDTQQTPQFGTIRDPDLDQGDIVFRSLTQPKPSRSTPQSRPGTTLISKVTGVDYSRLRDLLEAGKWKEADLETSRAMLQAAGRENRGWETTEDLDKFSCEDLRIIDQLWLESSRGKFGFSVQKDIYQNLGGTDKEVWDNFGVRVGWRKEERWLSDYNQLTFNLNAPKGQLPVLLRTRREEVDRLELRDLKLLNNYYGLLDHGGILDNCL